MFKQIKKTETVHLEGFHSVNGKGYTISLIVSCENNELKHYGIETKLDSEEWDDHHRSNIKPATQAKLVSLAMAEVLKIDEQCRLPKKG